MLYELQPKTVYEWVTNWWPFLIGDWFWALFVAHREVVEVERNERHKIVPADPKAESRSLLFKLQLWGVRTFGKRLWGSLPEFRFEAPKSQRMEKYAPADGDVGEHIVQRIALLAEYAPAPSDFIWKNLSASKIKRWTHELLAMMMMGAMVRRRRYRLELSHAASPALSLPLQVALCVYINIRVYAQFRLPKVMGAFTHTDQKCVDVAYLRDPAMAEHCGLRNAAGWYSDALDGAAAPSDRADGA